MFVSINLGNKKLRENERQINLKNALIASLKVILYKKYILMKFAKLVNMILKGKQSQDAVTIAKQEAEMRRLVNIQQAFAEQLRVQYANNDQ